MALPPEDQASLRAWNASHPYEDQYNTATGKVIPGSAKPNPNTLGGGGASVTIAPAPKVSQASGGGTAAKSASRSSGGVVNKAAAPTAASPKLDDEELAQQYGMTQGLLNAYPELKKLFGDAVSGTWTPDKFQAKLRETTWYKTMSDTQRKAITMQYTDPATYGKLWNTTQSHVRLMMADMGADPNNWDQINTIAGRIITEGYNDDQARDYLGQFIVFGNGGLAGGKAGATQQNLNQYAYAMGVRNSDQWIQDAVRNVVRGKSSEQDFKNQIMQQSIAAFPQWEKQLMSGSTMMDLASPYTQSMSQILEIPPGSINLFDNTIRSALSWKDPQGQAGAKPIWQFQNDLRTDDRWKKTQNAQDAAMGVAHKVMQDFGIAS